MFSNNQNISSREVISNFLDLNLVLISNFKVGAENAKDQFSTTTEPPPLLHNSTLKNKAGKSDYQSLKHFLCGNDSDDNNNIDGADKEKNARYATRRKSKRKFGMANSPMFQNSTPKKNTENGRLDHRPYFRSVGNSDEYNNNDDNLHQKKRIDRRKLSRVRERSVSVKSTPTDPIKRMKIKEEIFDDSEQSLNFVSNNSSVGAVNGVVESRARRRSSRPIKRKTMDDFDYSGSEQIEEAPPLNRVVKTEPEVEQTPKEIECSLCPMTFAFDEALRRHSVRAHRDRKCYCSICSQAFAHKSHLKVHMKQVHNETFPLPEPRPVRTVQKTPSKIKQETVYKTETIYNPETDYNPHAYNPLYCEICDKFFTQAGYLKIHKLAVHEKVRHTCTTCRKNYSGRSQLLRHIKSAHLRRRYLCPVCSQRFSQQGSVKIHMKNVHKTKDKDIHEQSFQLVVE